LFLYLRKEGEIKDFLAEDTTHVEERKVFTNIGDNKVQALGYN
jgi:hypothetical protein